MVSQATGFDPAAFRHLSMGRLVELKPAAGAVGWAEFSAQKMGLARLMLSTDLGREPRVQRHRLLLCGEKATECMKEETLIATSPRRMCSALARRISIILALVASLAAISRVPIIRLSSCLSQVHVERSLADRGEQVQTDGVEG